VAETSEDNTIDWELLTLTQLKQVLNATPQPYRIHAQVDTFAEKQTSQGSPFLELKLADSGGSLVWRVFDNAPAFGSARQLQRGAFIEIAAQWIDSGKYGPEPRQAQWRKLADHEKERLLAGDPELARRQSEDFDSIVRTIDEMADPRLRALCSRFLHDHGERFRRTGAARGNHHARRGGLVEHVAQMMRSALALARAYPNLNADLLVAGVLFHDCGKLWENAFAESGFQMPHHIAGEMLGHITIGMELVNKLWREVLNEPEAKEWTTLEPASEMVRLHLLHLIASHHGTHEFGAPVLPKTPEALVLHHVDNIDAKLEMFRGGYLTSAELGPGIFERFRPWPTNIVSPLPSVPRPTDDARPGDETGDAPA
jgi:3'-5' exoribonuclease